MLELNEPMEYMGHSLKQFNPTSLDFICTKCSYKVRIFVRYEVLLMDFGVKRS